MYELLCKRCKATYPGKSKEWRCRCGGPLNVSYISPADQSKLAIRSGPPSVWRYKEALPVLRNENVISFGEGLTPLVEAELKGNHVLLKLDFISLTGSFKDRGTSVMVSKLRELGIKTVVGDSAGNAGASTAAYCAKAGIKCEIYVPVGATKSKLLQIQVYGAKVIHVQGDREAVAKAAMAASGEHCFVGHGWSPYFLEGTKTIAYELWEQLGWREPDAVIIPVGSGTLLLGAYYGFKELIETSKVKRMPKLFGVQSDLTSPVYHKYIRSLEHPVTMVKKGGTTVPLAEEKNVWQPVRSDEIVNAVKDSGGMVLTITDVEMSEALRELGKRGIYVEPTSAASAAALGKLTRIGKITGNDVIVAVLTGSGLKATEMILRWVSVE